MTTRLLGIDCQKDFCDPAGALFVPGADADMLRLADFIVKKYEEIDELDFTMDTHNYYHIAHPVYWVDSENSHPAPFTVIEAADVEIGRYKTYNPEDQEWALNYVRKLAESGRYELRIWNPHCLVGGPGANLPAPLQEAVKLWEVRRKRAATYWFKGLCPHTEQYSIVKAEVPFPNDPTTEVNWNFIKAMRSCDRLLVVGEERGHCVGSTLEDTWSYAEIKGDDIAARMTFLSDACSSIPGMEKLGDDKIAFMTDRGMKVSTTTEVFNG